MTINPLFERNYLSRRCPARLILTLTFSAAVLVQFGWTAALAGNLEDVRAASDSAGATIRKAVVDEDGTALASVFTEDGAIISPNGQVIRGRLTIKTSATLLFLTMGGGSLDLVRQGISLIDSTAYETGHYSFRRSDDESTDQTWSGRYTVIWQREVGRWKIDRIIGLR